MTSRDFEPVRYTRYAEECCHFLSEAGEFPTDVYLVQVVKLLYLGDKISRTLNPQDFDPSSNIAAPVGASVKSLEAELQSLKPLVEPDILQHGKRAPPGIFDTIAHKSSAAVGTLLCCRNIPLRDCAR